MKIKFKVRNKSLIKWTIKILSLNEQMKYIHSSMKKQIICKWNSSNEQKIVQMRNKYFKWEKNISNEKKNISKDKNS